MMLSLDCYNNDNSLNVATIFNMNKMLGFFVEGFVSFSCKLTGVKCKSSSYFFCSSEAPTLVGLKTRATMNVR